MRLGFDLKQTENGEWGVIEINGENSGLEGLKSLWGKDYFETRRLKSYLKNQKWPSEFTDDLYARKFYGESRGIPDVKARDFIDATRNRTMLRERLSRGWEVSTINDRERLLGSFAFYLQIWQQRNEKINEAVRKIKDRLKSSENLGYYETTFEILHSLWGITRFALDDEIGLIVETQGAWDNPGFYDLKELGAFLSLVYKFYEPSHGPKLIQVDKYDLDGNLWLHPSHYVIPETNFILRSRDQHLVVLPAGRNPERLEKLTQDKISQKEVIPEQYLAPYAQWTGDFEAIVTFIEGLKTNSSPLLNVKSYPYVVIKQKNGSHGHHVYVVEMDDQAQIKQLLSAIAAGEALVEGFIPSKSIINPCTGKAHDGCMRLAVECMVSTRNQSLLVLSEMGYWRLSPAPLDALETQKEASLKANLTGRRPAIPMEAKTEELEAASQVVRNVVKLLFNKGFFTESL